jgi:hypothetical protein
MYGDELHIEASDRFAPLSLEAKLNFAASHRRAQAERRAKAGRSAAAAPHTF